ncbi:thymidine kinase 2, mitochondrial-like isoform X2 [Lycorma delicatula]
MALNSTALEISKNRPLRVSIEGNVGCGKSTLIRHFKSYIDVDAKSEPLSDWRNVQGHNLLHLTYADPKRWNFTFQHYVQLSRLNLQTSQSNKKIQLFERSLQNNRYCFVEMAYKRGLLEKPEYITLCEWYDWIEKNMDINLDLIVYLRSSPEVVFNRMQLRNRPEESTVSLDYLTDLHRQYEKWLMECELNLLPAPVVVLDVDRDLKYVSKMYSQLEQYLLERNSISNKRFEIHINENEVCV